MQTGASPPALYRRAPWNGNEVPQAMDNQLTTRAEPARTGWASRFFGGLVSRKRAATTTESRTPREKSVPTSGRVRGMARQLIDDDRYAFILLREAVDDISQTDAAPAWKTIAEQMALVPAGILPLVHSSGAVAPAEVQAFYLDRHAVTNRQFHRFVESGGYDNLEIWPQEVWPSLMKFSDKSHYPGPRDWEYGKFPAGKADFPVVGICWYEAVAFATWSGKRLPSAAEWQKAGGWPQQLNGGACSRYPWGDVFDPAKANIATSGPGHLVPVHGYPEGATPNGIYQMTGNVWEWLSDRLDAIPCHPDEDFHAVRLMRRIVGGAFDTYFPAEGTCQFITGQPELDRRDNIGFRCAISVSRLRARP
jgi:iron(II)-dependent oxidoreductase